MSKLAKGSFYTACAFTLGAMAYVHYRQFEDRHLLHQGIVRDTETQHMRQMANRHSLQTQIDITKKLTEQQQQQQKLQEGGDESRSS